MLPQHPMVDPALSEQGLGSENEGTGATPTRAFRDSGPHEFKRYNFLPLCKEKEEVIAVADE